VSTHGFAEGFFFGTEHSTPQEEGFIFCQEAVGLRNYFHSVVLEQLANGIDVV